MTNVSLCGMISAAVTKEERRRRYHSSCQLCQKINTDEASLIHPYSIYSLNSHQKLTNNLYLATVTYIQEGNIKNDHSYLFVGTMSRIEVNISEITQRMCKITHELHKEQRSFAGVIQKPDKKLCSERAFKDCSYGEKIVEEESNLNYIKQKQDLEQLYEGLIRNSIQDTF